MSEKRTYQFYNRVSGQWQDCSERSYLAMINMGHDGRGFNSKGEIVDGTREEDKAPQPVKEETQGEDIAPTGEAETQDKMIAEFMSVFGLSFKSKKWTDEIEIIKSKYFIQRK